MKKKMRYAAVAMAALLMLSGCSSKKGTEAEAAQETTAAVVPVEVMTAEPMGISKSLTYVGKVAANDTVNVTSKISGQAKEVYVNVGDTVKKGQVLLLIDDKDIRDQISTSEAQLKVAESAVASAQAGLAMATSGGQTATQRTSLETAVKNAQIGVDNAKIGLDNAQNAYNNALQKYNDYSTMLTAGVITQNDFNSVELGYTQAQNGLNQAQNAYDTAVTGLEQAKTSLALYTEKTMGDSETTARNALKSAQASRDAAQNGLNILKSNLNYIRVTSPIDGVITSRNIEPTNMVSASSSPFVVADTSKVTVDVEVSERIINSINIGQNIGVNVNAVFDGPVNGTIKTINPAAGNSGSFTVKIELDNSDGMLKPGMVAHVSFVETSAQNVVVVPRNTVIEDSEAPYVYVTDGKTATKKYVTTGIDDGANVEISGIEFGEQIIISGQNYVADGGPVTIETGEESAAEPETGKEE